MQTALHIMALIDELHETMVGGEIISTEFYKKRRAAYFFVRRDKTTRTLGLVYHPAGWGTFCVPAGKVKIDTNEKPWPIFGLDGATVIDIAQRGIDRIFDLTVTHEGAAKTIVFEALGPNSNLWLLDDNGGRRATLRKRDFTEGEPYEAAPVADRFNPLEVTSDNLKEAANDDSGVTLLTLLKKKLAGFNETLAREVMARADIDAYSLDELSDEDWEALATYARRVAAFFHRPEKGYLYTPRGGVIVYPFKLKSVDSEPEKLKSLSLA
ncbi:hypothetical protein GF377_08575, partial [candidate division GN15 bacterium]|nr:hypothetical protein [candidate division GN15 bacterium]